MASPSLVPLAPKLQLALFRSMDDFADISALICTSIFFHAIWTVHVRSICSAVLPRVIDCLADAQDLLDMQKPYSLKLHEKLYAQRPRLALVDWVTDLGGGEEKK